MGRKYTFRKATPQPPRWWWWINDGCWDCNCNYHGCRSCKRLKEANRKERDKRERIEKQKFPFLLNDVLEEEEILKRELGRQEKEYDDEFCRTS